jgi:hypothetical protein
VQIALLDDVPVNKTNLFEPCTEMSLLSGLLRGLIEILASANPSFRISFASAGILEGTGPRQVQRARGSESSQHKGFAPSGYEKYPQAGLLLRLSDPGPGRVGQGASGHVGGQPAAAHIASAAALYSSSTPSSKC